MNKRILIAIFVILLLVTGPIQSDSIPDNNSRRELIIETAKEIILTVKYCTLISRGLDGFPNARTMDPFPPDKNWVIWMGTNSQSRKVKEILKNNKISVFYESPDGDGYVTLKGSGFINNEQENRVIYFKDGWKEFYPRDRKNFTLIKFIPELLEIVSYERGLLGEKTTWAAPSIKLKKN